MPDKSVNPDTYIRHITHAPGMPELAQALVDYGADSDAEMLPFDVLDENDQPTKLFGYIKTLSQEVMCVTGVLLDASGDRWEFTLRRNSWRGSAININAQDLANINQVRR